MTTGSAVMFGKLLGGLQSAVNSSTGGYSKNYLDRYPGDKHKCRCCGATLSRSVPGQVTIDHIVPQKFGGTNAITNLQVLCRSCNSKKSAKINALTLKYSGEALVREIKRQCKF